MTRFFRKHRGIRNSDANSNKAAQPDLQVRHQLPSLVLSLDDEPYRAPAPFVRLCLRAIEAALEVDLEDIKNRTMSAEWKEYLDCWPGEHYKLLAGFVQILQPGRVVEIGTFTGAGTLCLKKFLPGNGRLVTYDVIPWRDVPETLLADGDFDGRLEQRLRDISAVDGAVSEIELLESAELIFVDAAKDGLMEQRIVTLFDTLRFRATPVVLFDDIRMMTMLSTWRRIKHPKQDLTSFGHWSGTGAVLWD